MRTFVCTCGTSIAMKRKVSLDRFLNVPLSAWEEKKNDIESVKDCVAEALSHISLPKELDDTSAEIKSLVKMGLDKKDAVILITSETIDGRLCAEIVSAFLLERGLCTAGAVQIKLIKGLQATDGKRFQKEGLKNLINYLISLEHEDLIFNPTGGYKSVVPYLSLMGMIFNKPVKYIHEDSNDVITLTGIPLILDDNFILRIEKKLKKIEKETAVSKEAWQQGIDFHDHRFDCFVEEDNGQVTLSGIGLLFWGRFKRDFPEELLREEKPAAEKENKLLRQGVGHHGLDRLKTIAGILLQSPYVKGVPNSCNNQPNSRVWVKTLKGTEAKQHLQREIEGFCIVTDIHSDAGYSFLIETTARDYGETQQISDILNRKYFT